jgi:hypothetical protein
MFAHSRPGLFNDARWRFNTERSLRNGFFGLLEDATLLDRRKGEARLLSARKIVMAAEEQVDAAEEPIPSIAELCRGL